MQQVMKAFAGTETARVISNTETAQNILKRAIDATDKAVLFLEKVEKSLEQGENDGDNFSM